MTDTLNSDQQAPAWELDQLAGFRLGDLVRLPSVSGAHEVIGFRPPSAIVLRTPTGKVIVAGWRAVSRAHLKKRR